MNAIIILLGLFLLVLFWAVGAYNRLVSLHNRAKNAFGQIDVQLKRRHDLIPNLVETAKAYMKHERETLEAVIAARNQAVAAGAGVRGQASAVAVQQVAEAENALSAMLGKMFALSEAYPELQANQNMMQLTEELSSTENRIAFARQTYNDGVMQYNIALQQFPGSMVANMFSFRPEQLLQATESVEERQPVKVAF
jgi:LemA protein